MMDARHFIAFAAVFLASVSAGMAQTHADPDAAREENDLRVKEIRRRMDIVRRTRHRPTVALVLSGGGAKGAAHVGVIQYLESKEIPIDIVMGTSMGGLVGGLYSLGYTGAQLDSIIRDIDWDMALSDKVPRHYLSYSTIKYKEKYALSFPFFYDKLDFIQQKEDELQYPHRSDRIHFGAEDDDDASNMVKDNLLGSLPSGMVYGQNVNNIFSSLTVGYQDDIDFYWDLPTPFLCVATDLVTGTAKIWTKGKLNTALRSTMSIPGLFTPVKVDGMVLVDGGMRNNYPNDLAKKCGADIVIGVNLSGGYKSYAEINNLGDIIGTSIDLMGRDSFRNTEDIPDVAIRPDLHEFNMLSFDTRSIDIIIQRGYEAAVSAGPQIDSIKKVIGSDKMNRQADPASDIRRKKVMVSGVEITGVNDKESSYLQNKIRVEAGTVMGSKEIEDAEATIFGTNAFDYVNYELLGSEEPYRLRFNCKKGPISKVGIGGRFDTEEVVAVLVNVGWGAYKLQGSSLDFTGKVGANPYASLTYSYVAPKGMTVNASASLRYTDRNTFSIGDNNFRINFLNAREEFYLSNIRWSQATFRVGVRNDFYNISQLMAEQVLDNYNSAQLSNNYLSLFVNGRNDSLDDGYIPTKGHSMGISYNWIFGGYPTRYNDFHAIQFDYKRVFGSDRLAFIPSVNIRTVFGDDVPVPFTNTMGGTMPGRYLEQQIPFIGINNAAAMNKILGTGRLDLRVKLLRNNYLTAIFNLAVSADSFRDFEDWNDMVSKATGFGLQYTYDTIVGPFTFNLHWSDYSKKVGAYVSLGFDL